MTTAIAFARYSDGDFGWRVVDPGHGLVFAQHAPPAGRRGGGAAVGRGHVRAAAAARRTPACCPQPLQDYLLDIQPGYDDRPGPRRLQPRLDHRRRERDRRRRPGADRYALGDPARRHRSRVTMAEAEQPERLRGGREVTVDDVRQLVGVRRRRTSRADAQPDPDADRGPAGGPPGAALRRARRSRGCESLGFTGEVRGTPEQPGMRAAAAASSEHRAAARTLPGATTRLSCRAVERAAALAARCACELLGRGPVRRRRARNVAADDPARHCSLRRRRRPRSGAAA